jgi:hypothetical protein
LPDPAADPHDFVEDSSSAVEVVFGSRYLAQQDRPAQLLVPDCLRRLQRCVQMRPRRRKVVYQQSNLTGTIVNNAVHCQIARALSAWLGYSQRDPGQWLTP